MNSKKAILYTLLLSAALFAFQTAASKLGSFIAGCFDYSGIDPDNCFMRISVHHIVQLLAALAGIRLITKLKANGAKQGFRFLLMLF